MWFFIYLSNVELFFFPPQSLVGVHSSLGSNLAHIVFGASWYLGQPTCRPPAQQSITVLPVSFLSSLCRWWGDLFLSSGDRGEPGELNWVLDRDPRASQQRGHQLRSPAAISSMSHITSSGLTGCRSTPRVLQMLKLSLCFLFLSASILPLLPPRVPFCLCFYLYLLPPSLSLSLPLSAFITLFLISFVSAASSLPVCLPSEWTHINSSLCALAPAGFCNTLWSVCLCVQAKSNTSSLISLLYHHLVHAAHKWKIRCCSWFQPPASHTYLDMRMQCKCANVSMCNECIGGVNVPMPYARMSVENHFMHMVKCKTVGLCRKAWCNTVN